MAATLIKCASHFSDDSHCVYYTFACESILQNWSNPIDIAANAIRFNRTLSAAKSTAWKTIRPYQQIGTLVKTKTETDATLSQTMYIMQKTVLVRRLVNGKHR